MTFVVPFDGSALARAALVRSVEFHTVLDEQVVAVSVIPEGNARYARKRGWIEETEPFARDEVVSHLHQQVVELAPSADFRQEFVDRFATSGEISRRIRSVALGVDASIVFIGSENAGRQVASLSSVGVGVASDDDYDVMIVRGTEPSKVGKLRRSSPHRREKSDFYPIE